MTNFWEKLKKPISILAPMDDVTDLVFREIIGSIAKPDVMFTEFTSAEALASKGQARVAKKLLYTKVQRPIVAQIWGSTPESFKVAAEFIADRGFDGIDINMGCPARDVMKRCAGAGLIGNLKLVEQLITAVREGAPNIPLSIKTRLAPTDALTKEWLSFLLSQDISVLTLHARTAQEMSKVPARWEEVGKLVELKNKLNQNVLINGNGDITSYQEIVEKHNTYGVDGVMVGTGIFHNPWLFDKNTNAPEHTHEEYFELLKAHTKLFNDTWGKEKNYAVMKKFFKIYVKDYGGAKELRQKLMDTKSYEEFCAVLPS